MTDGSEIKIHSESRIIIGNIYRRSNYLFYIMVQKQQIVYAGALFTIIFVGMITGVFFDRLNTTFLLRIIIFFSAVAILGAVSAYIYLRNLKKVDPSSKNTCPGTGFFEKILFIERWPKVVLASVVIGFIVIAYAWFWCHGDVVECPDKLVEWLRLLLSWQVGSAALFISLSVVVIKLSSSAFSLRVLNSIICPIYRKKAIMWVSLSIYVLAFAETLALTWILSFEMIKPEDLATPGGFLAIFILFIHNVIAFGVLVLYFLLIFNIMQSEHIIKTSLHKISPQKQKDDPDIPCSSHQGDGCRTSPQGQQGPSSNNDSNSNDAGENEKDLQLIFNVINSSIQQSDTLSSKNGIQSLKTKISQMREDSVFIQAYIGHMTNSAKRALLLGDEATAILILEAVSTPMHLNVRSDSSRSSGTGEPPGDAVLSLKQMINSYSNLSLFSIERGCIDSCSKCVKYFKECNTKVFDHLLSEVLISGISNQDATSGHADDEDDKNLHNFSVACMKSASIVGQIAAQKNYETFIEVVIEAMSSMHKNLSSFLKSSSGINGRLPTKHINYYIWSIKDAGVSAANSGLEKAAIEYIHCLKEFGESLSDITPSYNETNSQHLAKSMTHISTSIREIGQRLAERKHQEGTIEAISAIKYLALKALDQNESMWYPGNKINDTSQKLAFVRIIWNLKDLGRSAAESGIEKAIVRVIEGLFDLLTLSLDPGRKWIGDSKKTKALLRIGEGLYEISIKTKHQDLQEALTKIICYNICCIGSLDAESKADYNQELVWGIYLKTFLHLTPVEITSETAVQSFLRSPKFTSDSQLGDKYSAFVPQVSRIIYKYCCQMRPPNQTFQA